MLVRPRHVQGEKAHRVLARAERQAPVSERSDEQAGKLIGGASAELTIRTIYPIMAVTGLYPVRKSYPWL